MRTLFYLTFSLLIFSSSALSADEISFNLEDGDVLAQFKKSDDTSYHLDLPSTTTDTHLLISIKPKAGKELTFSLQNAVGEAVPFKSKSSPEALKTSAQVKSTRYPHQFLANITSEKYTIVVSTEREIDLDIFSVKSLQQDSLLVTNFGRLQQTPRRKSRIKTDEQRLIQSVTRRMSVTPLPRYKQAGSPGGVDSSEWDNEDGLPSPDVTKQLQFTAFEDDHRAASTTTTTTTTTRRSSSASSKRRKSLSPTSARKAERDIELQQEEARDLVQKTVSSRRLLVYGGTSPTSAKKEKQKKRASLSPSQRAARRKNMEQARHMLVRSQSQITGGGRQQHTSTSTSSATVTSSHSSQCKVSSRRKTKAGAASASSKLSDVVPRKTKRKRKIRFKDQLIEVKDDDGMRTPEADSTDSLDSAVLQLKTPERPKMSASLLSALTIAASPQKKLKNKTAFNTGWKVINDLDEDNITFHESDHVDMRFSENPGEGMSKNINIEAAQTLLHFSAIAEAVSTNCFIVLYEKEGEREQAVKLTLDSDTEVYLVPINTGDEHQICFTAEIDPAKTYRIVFCKDESEVKASLSLKDISFEAHID